MFKSFFFIIPFFYFSSSAQQKDISIADKVISISGRKLEINADGFPKQIQSYYDRQFDRFGFKATNLLYEPIHFHLYTSPKTQEKLVVNTFNLLSKSADSVVWDATSASANISQHVKAKMHSNGLVYIQVRLKALKDVSFSTINFHIPFEKTASKYLVGLGNNCYLRPDTVKWNWKTGAKINPQVLIGNDNAALYFSFDDQTDMSTLGFKNGWRNDNKGVLQINIKGSSMLAEFSTGAIALKAGEVMAFDFSLLVTPLSKRDAKRKPEKRFNSYIDQVAN